MDDSFTVLSGFKDVLEPRIHVFELLHCRDLTEALMVLKAKSRFGGQFHVFKLFYCVEVTEVLMVLKAKS